MIVQCICLSLCVFNFFLCSVFIVLISVCCTSCLFPSRFRWSSLKILLNHPLYEPLQGTPCLMIHAFSQECEPWLFIFQPQVNFLRCFANVAVALLWSILQFFQGLNEISVWMVCLFQLNDFHLVQFEFWCYSLKITFCLSDFCLHVFQLLTVLFVLSPKACV